jgi:N-acetylmuramoyl-L-alanine amidase
MTYSINNHKLQGDGVVYRQSPNHSGEIDPQIIVMHHTGGWPDGKGSVSWLCNPEANASAHLVINDEGLVTQLLPFNIKAWHAGSSTSSYRGQSPNSISVGIELANPGRLVKINDTQYAQDGNPDMVFNGEEWGIQWFEAEWDKGYYIPFTEKQQKATTEIGRLLVQEYDLLDTTTHQRCDPTRKVDPHPGYDLDSYNVAVLGAEEATPKPPVSGKQTVETERVTVAYKWPSYQSVAVHYRPGRRLDIDRYGSYVNEVDGYTDTSVWYCVTSEEFWVNERDVRANGSAGARCVDLEA